MNNNLNEKFVNLIARLKARLSTAKIVKSVASLALAAGIAVSACGCENIVNPFYPQESDTEKQTTIETDELGNIIGDYETESSNNSDHIGSDKEPENNPTQSGYSEILQYVLDNPEYDQTIREAHNLKNEGIRRVLEKPQFQPHPYGFFEDEGYDVNAIRNGVVESMSIAYTLNKEPNNLYIMSRVECAGEQPYYTEYILKYKLTDKEMSDYKMIFENNYIQAIFMHDAISEFKTPEIVYETKITINAHKLLYDAMKKYDLTKKLLNGTRQDGMSLIDFNKEEGTFKLLLLSQRNLDDKMTTKGTMAIANLTEGSMKVGTNSDNAFFKPCAHNHFKFPEELNTQKGEAVVIYQTSGVELARTTNIEE